MTAQSARAVLVEIVRKHSYLDPVRVERGMVDGRRTSTPVSRRSIANDDAIVLSDRRTGVLAVLRQWADRTRQDLDVRWSTHPCTVDGQAAFLVEHWDWAMSQPWGPEMLRVLKDLDAALEDVVGEHRVRVITCPACRLPARLDRYVVEHGECVLPS